METIDLVRNWNNQKARQATTLFISLVIVYMLLMIPIKYTMKWHKQPKTITLELNKVIVKKPDKKVIVENKPIKKEMPKPIISKPKPITKPVKKTISKPVSKPKEVIKKHISIIQKEKTLPTAGTILNSMENKNLLFEVGDDFKAVTGHEDDFIARKPIQPEWYKPHKYLDESIDKPELEMDFYSDGVIGSIERIVDKYVPKKRFVTKYGTKIDCIFIGTVICSWK